MPILRTLLHKHGTNEVNNTALPEQHFTPPSRGERWSFLAIVVSIISLLALAFWFGLSNGQETISLDVVKPKLKWETKLSNEPIAPIPLSVDVDKAKVALGEQLFHDPRLSADSSISCASCHNLKTNGADNYKVSLGINGMPGVINTLTVFNSANNFALLWDGRVNTLEEQIDTPILNPNELGSNWSDIIYKLNQDKNFADDFKLVYTDGLTPNNIKNAIAEFERTLITPNSRFDQFLRGDKKALSEQQQHGYQLFKNYGCIACHQGMNVGGNMYQILGVMGDYFNDRGNITTVDHGRFNVTGKEQDRYYFRVPSLRNVAITAPYFHDGSANTLEQAIKVMAKYQLGRTIPKDDISAIITFLETLTGEYQGEPL